MKRFAPPNKNPRKTALMILIGTVLMVAGHAVYWEWEKLEFVRPLPPVALEEPVQEPRVLYEERTSHKEAHVEGEEKKKAVIQDLLDPPPLVTKPPSRPRPDKPVAILKPGQQDWKAFAVPAPSSAAKGKIVIIIDDMGVARQLSFEILGLPGPLTLSFLPYAPGLRDITAKARERGDELMIHMPMEAVNPHTDPGPIALLSDMSEAEMNAQMDKAFASFDGYVGMNNHMGSRLTQNPEAMHVVMNALARRGLLFVDSKTISNSVAGDVAAQHGLDYAQRDIFLDDTETKDNVMQSLAHLERIAKARGYAIAIGHPKKVTIEALREWLPTLKERGLELVPVSAVVKKGGEAKAMGPFAPAQPPVPPHE